MKAATVCMWLEPSDQNRGDATVMSYAQAAVDNEWILLPRNLQRINIWFRGGDLGNVNVPTLSGGQKVSPFFQYDLSVHK